MIAEQNNIDLLRTLLLIDAFKPIFSGRSELTIWPQPMREEMPPAPRVDILTPRENDVLALLIEGKSNRQIALELGISTTTVKCHVSSILSKLGVESRTEAVAMVLRHQRSNNSITWDRSVAR